MTTVVVLCHNLHPFPRSAEAIVSGALVDALRRRDHDVAVVTSPWGHRPLDGAEPLAADRLLAVEPRGGLPSWRHLPARSARGAAARVADRARTALGRAPYPVASWAEPAGDALLGLLDRLPGDTVVWARGLPESSLAAALAARSRRSFPLVCSLGDPLPVPAAGAGTDAAVARLAHRQVRALADCTDAWTFPSRRVADEVAAAGGLDPDRVLVLPHLLADHVPAERAPGHPPRLAYAGSAYRWLVDGPLVPALERAAVAGLVHPVLALRDADDATAAGVRRRAPHAEVHVDLDPAAAAALVEGADAVLAPGPRADLLYTKVVEALRHARPVLAVTPVPGTTADLVAAAGGVVVPAGSNDDELDDALRRLVAVVGRGERAAAQEVAERLATPVVAERAEAVLTFALRRHRAAQAGTAPPEPPPADRWP